MPPSKFKPSFDWIKTKTMETLWIRRLSDDNRKMIMYEPYIHPYHPAETPLNIPSLPCSHCAVITPRGLMQPDDKGHLFCSTTCRAAAEIFAEWQARESQ